MPEQRFCAAAAPGSRIPKSTRVSDCMERRGDELAAVPLTCYSPIETARSESVPRDPRVLRHGADVSAEQREDPGVGAGQDQQPCQAGHAHGQVAAPGQQQQGEGPACVQDAVEDHGRPDRARLPAEERHAGREQRAEGRHQRDAGDRVLRVVVALDDEGRVPEPPHRTREQGRPPEAQRCELLEYRHDGLGQAPERDLERRGRDQRADPLGL
eukprot:CAMPEP_0179143608 /NCGR_PEP_ID=MMETSP0796-20121207/69097_1 /TAXON_ID=73915 /ORGANISM="Pyrodinium bahamense, Strain pbaha01" /LENGTH=212 /DNA_ID=CAMNT_0020843683 /DNA_START=51 /DNA_END=686 /DNA_ORIENTATION=+